tara:strand:- start:729 stop:899 length:171 start_codon:yes stop_codon:yes gene_type:complete
VITLFAKMWNFVFDETMLRITPERKWVIHEYFKYFCFAGVLVGFAHLIVEVIRSVV